MTKPVRIAATHPDFLPKYATPGSAGADIFAAIDAPLSLAPGETCKVPCGIFLELPHLFEAQVRPRSGLAAKHSITVINSPGTIDSDYRGEVRVLLHNASQTETFFVEPKMRIAQIVIAPVVQADFKYVQKDDLSGSQRGHKGFGSSGV